MISICRARAAAARGRRHQAGAAAHACHSRLLPHSGAVLGITRCCPPRSRCCWRPSRPAPATSGRSGRRRGRAAGSRGTGRAGSRWQPGSALGPPCLRPAPALHRPSSAGARPPRPTAPRPARACTTSRAAPSPPGAWPLGRASRQARGCTSRRRQRSSRRGTGRGRGGTGASSCCRTAPPPCGTRARARRPSAAGRPRAAATPQGRRRSP
mmetsp:Transcript_53680/g.166199  ORF Transcript_53680/g.166199 Transcript_53680/m.166199 type:complete len:211 (-) Transcript_53680:152-784(-)